MKFFGAIKLYDWTVIGIKMSKHPSLISVTRCFYLISVTRCFYLIYDKERRISYILLKVFMTRYADKMSNESSFFIGHVA